MLLGNRLKELRKTQGLIQNELGEKVGVCGSAITMWEKNKRQPDYETLIKLADFFNVSTDYLLGRTEESVSINLLPAGLTEDEKYIIETFRTLNDIQKNAVKMVIKGYAGNSSILDKVSL